MPGKGCSEADPDRLVPGPDQNMVPPPLHAVRTHGSLDFHVLHELPVIASQRASSVWLLHHQWHCTTTVIWTLSIS